MRQKKGTVESLEVCDICSDVLTDIIVTGVL
jgi:hypothetical protein